MRKIVSLFLVLTFGLLIIYALVNSDINISKLTSDYYIDNCFEDVGSKNIVTGIYLDYRLFDSIFEAGILLVSVAGVIFMAIKDEVI